MMMMMMSTSGVDGHIALSSYPSMSLLFVDTFFEFGWSITLFNPLELQYYTYFRFIRLYMSLRLCLCSI